MKTRDRFILILHECKYEKKEWIVSVLLQGCIFSVVLFLFTVALNMENICGTYLKPLYEDGYFFELKGYTEEDLPELEKIGFRDVKFSEGSNSANGYLDDLDHVWIYKMQAVFDHKDIWNEDVDDVLGIMLFCQVILGATGVAMLLLMINNVSNSVAMKLQRRQRYIRMLEQLGSTRQMCMSVYYTFFAIRNMLALIMAVIVNVISINLLNDYLNNRMYIGVTLPVFFWQLFVFVLLISLLLIGASFWKMWRRIDEI